MEKNREPIKENMTLLIYFCGLSLKLSKLFLFYYLSVVEFLEGIDESLNLITDN